MRTSDRGRALRTIKGKNELAVFIFDARSSGIEKKLNAFSFKRFLEFRDDFGIFARNDLRAFVNDSDTAAEAAEHLAELKTDVSSTENEKVFGNGGELHNGFVSKVLDVRQARNGRNRGTAAGIDEDFFAFEKIIANSELVGRNELRVASVECQIGAFVDGSLLIATKAEDNFVFLRDDFLKIDADVFRVDAPAVGVAGVVRNLRAGNHGFRGSAADVDAGSAKISLFD